MGIDPIHQLQEYNQSIWLDNIDRSMIRKGELRRLIDNGLLGMTSNPTIFEKAISGSDEYDTQLRELASGGKDVPEILDGLMIKDIQMAADDFLPVYEKSRGQDGLVSIEIAPTLAYETEKTVQAARDLRRAVGKPNVLIKVPSTPQGIPAIEQLTGEGISINVTLIFSIETYEQVANAYISGLERLHQKNQFLGDVRSVASVFVSRTDTLVDQLLQEKLDKLDSSSDKSTLRSLLGKVAVANTKLIYRKYKEIFAQDRFEKLRALGAHVQRPLWGSTGTKNPKYSDVLYVEELIGGDVVNTVPSNTLTAFLDHGKVRRSIEEDLETAQSIVKKLGEAGIDLKKVTQELQEKGVKAFEDSYYHLIDRIKAKREQILSK